MRDASIRMQLGLEQSVLRVPLLNPARVPATPLAPPHAAALALLGLLCLTRTCLHFWADRPGWLAARSLANLPHADRTDQQSQQTQAISRENGFVPGVLPPPLAAQSAVNVNAMAITFDSSRGRHGAMGHMKGARLVERRHEQHKPNMAVRSVRDEDELSGRVFTYPSQAAFHAALAIADDYYAYYDHDAASLDQCESRRMRVEVSFWDGSLPVVSCLSYFLSSSPSEAVRNLWLNAQAVCFDVDSTVVTEEGIDVLAASCGAGQAVAEWTKKAMGGDVPFEKALSARLEIIAPSQQQIDACLRRHPLTLTPGVEELIRLLQTRGTHVYLVSGGFRQMIHPLARKLNISLDHVYANQLLLDKDGNFLGHNHSEPTCRAGGKARVLQTLKQRQGYRPLVMVGDGATDMEARPPADLFRVWRHCCPRGGEEGRRLVCIRYERPDISPAADTVGLFAQESNRRIIVVFNKFHVEIN
eukprot:g81782.t1